MFLHKIAGDLSFQLFTTEDSEELFTLINYDHFVDHSVYGMLAEDWKQ